VKVSTLKHACSSSRRRKSVKNATKHWICWKVKDFLIHDATLGAKYLCILDFYLHQIINIGEFGKNLHPQNVVFAVIHEISSRIMFGMIILVS
jgi:hypothetical protein